MKKVLIPTKLDNVARETLEAHGGYTVVQDADTDLLSLATAHADAYALIVRSEKVTETIIDALPECRVIVRAGAGYDNIDVRYARKRDIDVMNTPGANANAVAEEAIALMLADLRQIIPADASTRAGKWDKKAFMGRELAGKTVGIVGLGNIGRLVARRLRGFDCRLLGYDPLISNERARDCGVETVALDELFAAADIVTLHLPETEETRGLISRELLERMPRGARLVNCARAGIIDEAALRSVRADRAIRFLNDVYPKDEPGPKSVADIADILMPHLGASTFEANYNAAKRAAVQLIDLGEKGITSFIVNRDIPEGLDRGYCELAFVLARLAWALIGRQAPLKMLETSFYGQLEPYANWLLVSIVAGIREDFDRLNDHQAAVSCLSDMGVEYVNRPVDPEKRFDNSITVDVIAEMDRNRLKRVSVRGTMVEGVVMVSRINEFDRLYFPPKGSTLFFLYDDRPGVIATISRALAEADVNIEDMRNPHDEKTNRSLAILKLNAKVDREWVDKVATDIKAHSALCLTV
jgi:D-3-phosphoglycerate dehydrogenase / 2-oxoglutarate reductase